MGILTAGLMVQHTSHTTQNLWSPWILITLKTMCWDPHMPLATHTRLGYGVDDLNVLPISSNISDHDMVFFHVNFLRSYSFTKSISFKKYQRMAEASRYHSIEWTLNEIDSSTMSARQLVQTQWLLQLAFFWTLHWSE